MIYSNTNFLPNGTQARHNTSPVVVISGNVKVEGKDNNLLELIAADPSFNLTLEELQATMEPSKYVGRAPIQVDKFLANVVNPTLEANKEDLGMTAEINV